MPINYSLYHPKWRLISKLIRFRRANNHCEWCGVPNGELIYRPIKNSSEWRLWPQGMQGEALADDGFKPVKIVLTVAHIDRDKNNNRFGNLAALCQRCHLKHDHKQHVDNRKYGRRHKENHQLKIEL